MSTHDSNREQLHAEVVAGQDETAEETARDDRQVPEVVCWQCEGADGPLLCTRCIAPRTIPPPSLTSWDVGALILNKMIGTGILTNPPMVLLYTGSGKAALGLWIGGFFYTILR